VGGQQLLLNLYVTSYPFLSLILGPVRVGLFSLGEVYFLKRYHKRFSPFLTLQKTVER
jgi:hypothetical protein